MVVKEGIGLLAGVVVLAGLAFAIANGGETAQVMNAFGSAFSNIIKAATGRG